MRPLPTAVTSARVPPGQAEARGPQNAPFLSPEPPPPPLPLGIPGTPHDPHLERVSPGPPAARLASPCACALGSACAVGRRCRRPECPPGRKMAAGSRGGPLGAGRRGGATWVRESRSAGLLPGCLPFPSLVPCISSPPPTPGTLRPPPGTPPALWATGRLRFGGRSRGRGRDEKWEQK